MADSATRSPAQPAVVLGLTLLVIGLTFALPFRLVPQSDILATSRFFSIEVANVYACVAWAGWTHFLFAFRGQGSALARIRDDIKNTRLIAYFAAVALTIVVLVCLRLVTEPSLFGAIVWLYFIDHFLKAELSFEGKTAPASILVRWLSSYQILLTFGWLTVILLNVGNVSAYPWLLWVVSLVLGAVVLALGGWRRLTSGDVRGPLLSLFFVAEALVWGAFSRYSGQMFLTGVYVFHIAAGSYFHYFGAYFFANARAPRRDVVLTPLYVVAINLVIVALGYFAAFEPSLSWLNPVLGIQWFTLWVAVHLVSSDLFPLFKTRQLRRRASET